jgi:PAS domain S-box-containing protein
MSHNENKIQQLTDENNDLKKEIQYLLKETERVKLIESELRTHQIELELQNEELKQTQYDLVMSRRKYRHLYENAPVGYIMTNTDYRIMELNDRAAILLRKPKSAVLNKDLSTFVDDESQNDFYFHFNRLAESKKSLESQIKLRLDNDIAIVRLNSSLTTDDTNTIYINTTLEDVTEKVRIENQLEAERLKYQELVESISDVIFQTDPEGNFIYLSPVFNKLYNYNIREIIGNHFGKFIHPEDSVILQETFHKVLLGHLTSFESRFIDKDGKTRYQRISVNVRYEDDEPVAVTGVMTDITDQKNAEEALKISEAKLRATINNFPNGSISLINSDYVFEIVGGSDFDRFNIDPKSMLNRKVENALLPYLASKAMEGLKKAFSGENCNYEVEFGGEIYHNVVSPVSLHDGQIDYCVFISTNITEQKNAESKLIESEEKYRNLISAIPSVVYTYSTKRGALFWSEKIADILGFSQQDLFDNPHIWNDSIHTDDKEKVNNFFSNQNIGKEHGIEYRIKSKAGEWKCFFDSFISKREVNGEIIIDGQAEDITQRKNAELELMESQVRLSLAVDSAEIGVWDLDLNANLLIWDDWMFKIFGINKDSFTDNYEAWQKCVHPDDKEKAFSEVNKAIKEKSIFDTVFRIIRGDGKVRYIKAYAKFQTDENNKPIRMTGVNYDITDIKEAEKALKESEEKARSYIENAPYGVFIADNNGNWIEVNEAASVTTGYKKEELLSMNIIDIVPEDMREDVIREFEKNFQYGKVEAEHNFINKSGELRLWEVNAVKLTDDLILGFTNDITERKKQEEQIRLSEALFKGTFDRSAIGMLLVSKDGRFQKVNSAFVDLLGYTEEELLSLSFPDITHPDDFGSSISAVNMIKREKSFFVEKRYRKKNGEYIWCQLSTSIIPDSKGDVQFFISNVMDLSERKENEAKIQEYLTQLENSENQLKQLNKDKDKFFSLIASDLRNSLNDFMLLTEEFSLGIKNLTLMQMQDKSKQMYDSSQKLVKVLENLLDWSRSQTQTLNFKPKEYDLYEFAVNNILAFKELAKQKNITLTNKVPMDTIAFVDYKMIDTILRNLISNAIKYSYKDGYIDLLLSQDDHSFYVSVKDNGTGISEENQKKLFKIGEKIDNDPIEHGTGLGLILCKEFISMHGGSINVDSELGVGTTFTINIPKRKG